MRIDRLDRFNPDEERNSKTNPKETDGEVLKTPESTEKKVSATEIAVFAGLLGLKAYMIFDNKRKEIQGAVSEAKQDFQTQPTAAKEIAGGLLMQLGSLALEYQREQQEEKLKIKQKFLSSLQKITTEANQLDLLKDYERLQNEVIQESLRKPTERMSLAEEEENEFKATIDPITKARQQAKSRVTSFIDNLTDLSRSKR